MTSPRPLPPPPPVLWPPPPPPPAPPSGGRWARVVLPVVIAIALIAGVAAALVARDEVTGRVPAELEDPTQGLREAVEDTRAVSTLKADLAIDIDGGFGSQELRLEGRLDLEALVGTTTVSAKGSGLNTGAEARFDGDVVWISFDGDMDTAAAFPEGKSWVEGTPTELSSEGSLSDPREVFAILDSLYGITEVKGSTSGEADGVAVRRYQVLLDLDQAAATLDAERAAALADAISLSSTDGEARVEAEVAVDEDGRIRAIDVDGRIVGGEEGLVIRYDAAFGAFDEEVERPDPPPEDEIARIDEVDLGVLGED